MPKLLWAMILVIVTENKLGQLYFSFNNQITIMIFVEY